MKLSERASNQVLMYSLKELSDENKELISEVEILQKQNDSLEHQLMLSLDKQDKLRAELVAYKYRLSEMMKGWK